MSLSKELLRISTSTRIFSDHLYFLHELEEKETKYGPSELPRRRLNDRQKPEMLVWFRSFVTVSCRCLQQNLEESVVCRMSPFVAVRRMSSVVPW